MPIDLLLLFDVSGSMQPHVNRIASAARRALHVLGDNDRVAIMVFDRTIRLRLPFRNSQQDIEEALKSIARQESYHGGTDITRALVVAASFIEVQARSAARHAIVILTDDQTDCGREDADVSYALKKADAVLSALIVPDEVVDHAYFVGTERVMAWSRRSSKRHRSGHTIGRHLRARIAVRRRQPVYR
jgi:uncharacterized protein with von Willebrand factor type A (vWA) domain